jgi:two-component system phosphate regulon sensor histidine kinase PhoR
MVGIRRVWKLYIFYTAVLIMVMAVSGLILQSRLKKGLRAHLQDDLLTLAKTMARVLPDTDKPSLLSPWCRQYQGLTGVRVTVLNREGKVIGESTGESVIGEIRLDRPEVSGALKEGTGTALRPSQTVKADMLYVAFLVPEKRKVLRLGLAMTEAKRIESQVMGFFAAILFLTPVLAILISFFFARHLTPAEESRIRGLKGKRR